MNAEFWDTRYNPATGFLYGTAPNDFLASQVSRLPRCSRVLSLGEGEGRNAVFLAKLGHTVHCIDLSKVGLEKAALLATENGVGELVTTEVVDLDKRCSGSGGGDDKLDCVLSVWCHLPSDLEKRVLGMAAKALKTGGLVILEHYSPKNIGRGTGGPQDADLCIDPVALKNVLAEVGLKIVSLGDEVSEGKMHQGMSATVQLVAQKV
ncbi:S-adenosyl-L-methionine-dependent methyltransferase [Rhizoclosmatium globosum]|uniref:S-adenosyl-L-methionine-dependent methyltransferase n=1 Tax=Rhizoclosmatium globosum TaxID=329046 RepID=A0A1Y2BTF0_9FUNG|nr:S-adenosyl-L-methionine-dependent methyltransferase [Rhizoclosmatium globosum]|eukprot:ORY37974.1 S-adenosyl-L-methionine-dependent methyltransferase [Rhizoclosmatium globosum]